MSWARDLEQAIRLRTWLNGFGIYRATALIVQIALETVVQIALRQWIGGLGKVAMRH